jgi:sigma-B regulation protein RsbU (phosphoserine phosphatase)
LVFTIPFKKINPAVLRFTGFAVFAVLAFLLSWFRVFELYELQTYDWRCQLRLRFNPRPISDKVVLIDIWDDTLGELGAWPFDRGYHADLIKILGAYGVKAVALDLLFVEPREGDDAVAKAARDAGNVYFVYAFFDPKNKNRRFYSEKMLAPLIESYESAAKGSGHVNTAVDMDGKRRKVIPVIEYQGKNHYQFSIRIAMDLLGDDFKVPLDEKGYFIINYAGPWEKTFRHYSYYDVLASYLEILAGQKPRIDLESLRGKVCFVGLTSLGSHDTSPIPIQSIYPMVGLHANVLNSILNRDYIYRAGHFWNCLVLVLLGGLIGWTAFRLKPIYAFFATLTLMVFFVFSVVLIFVAAGIWADLFYPFSLFAVIYAAATLGRTMAEMRKRELIENELKIASQIQQSFLPTTLPEVKGLSVAVYMKPAKAVGGDLYSFVAIGDGKLGVMAGDVSGKGTPAALFMAKVVSEFKLFSREKEDPAEVLEKLNNSISSESTGGLFVTLSYVIFDRGNKKMAFSNGGHLPMVLVRQEGEPQLLSADEGMPVGVMDGIPYSRSEFSIQKGDCFAFYSDGVSEARNRRKDEFGTPALQNIILANRNRSARQILDAAVEELNRFMGKADQHDDITLIIVTVDSVDFNEQ